MVWVDSFSEVYNVRPASNIECYADPVYLPQDILMQASYTTPLATDSGVQYRIEVYNSAGDLLETLSTGNIYFDVFSSVYSIGGLPYYYTNIRCNSFSPAMLANGCFILRFSIYDDAGRVYFDKYTQKYLLRTSVVAPANATISGATDVIYLCVPVVQPNLCGYSNVQFVSIFDCVDSYSGEYYGNDNGFAGAAYGNVPFNYVKINNIDGRVISSPKRIKRTISLNCRTQKTSKTDLYLLKGNVLFPEWKKNEIEDMLLANRLYADGKEYKSEGGVIFKQLERPFNCQYLYQLAMELTGCFQWQIFGCDPECAQKAYYFLIP